MREQLLKVDEVAERLNAHPSSVSKWLTEGELRGLKLAGKRWRIPQKSALREFLDLAAQAAKADVTG